MYGVMAYATVEYAGLNAELTVAAPNTADKTILPYSTSDFNPPENQMPLSIGSF